MWMNFENAMLKQQNPVTKDHIFYDSAYIKCPEEVNCLGQKVG